MGLFYLLIGELVILIKFNNWDKYNKRQKDIRNPYWFSMSNNFFYDPEFYDFTSDEKCTMFYLLAEASRGGCYGECKIIETHYVRTTGINKQILNRTIDKLLKLKVAAVSRQDGGVNPASTEQDRTEQDRTEQNNNTILDFDFLYSKYPLKKGKSDGISRLSKTIKSADEFDLVSKAIDKYTHHIKKNGTEPKYIKQFSTFVSTWRDWLDDDAGTAIEIKNKTNAQKMSDQNMEMMERVRRGEL